MKAIPKKMMVPVIASAVIVLVIILALFSGILSDSDSGGKKTFRRDAVKRDNSVIPHRTVVFGEEGREEMKKNPPDSGNKTNPVSGTSDVPETVDDLEGFLNISLTRDDVQGNWSTRDGMVLLGIAGTEYTLYINQKNVESGYCDFSEAESMKLTVRVVRRNRTGFYDTYQYMENAEGERCLVLQGQNSWVLYPSDIVIEDAEQDEGDDDKVAAATEDPILGVWYCTTHDNDNVVISRADEQAGGYYVDFLFGAYTVTGNASLSGDTLTLVQCVSNRTLGDIYAFQEDKIPAGEEDRFASVEGQIKRTNAGMTFTVTKSEHPDYQPGTTHEYVRKANATGLTVTRPTGITGYLIGSFQCTAQADAYIRTYTLSPDGTWSGELVSSAGTAGQQPVKGTYEVVDTKKKATHATFRLLDQDGAVYKEGTLEYLGRYALQFKDDNVVYYRK